MNRFGHDSFLQIKEDDWEKDEEEEDDDDDIEADDGGVGED